MAARYGKRRADMDFRVSEAGLDTSRPCSAVEWTIRRLT